jgi:serine/threonine protein kinase
MPPLCHCSPLAEQRASIEIAHPTVERKPIHDAARHDCAHLRRVCANDTSTRTPGVFSLIRRIKFGTVVDGPRMCGFRLPTVVMELVEGISLTERIGASIDRDELRRIGHGLLDAIGAYHANNLAHLDLHDHNVIVGPQLIKVLDAIYFDTAALSSTATRTGERREKCPRHPQQMLYSGGSTEAAAGFLRATARAHLTLVALRAASMLPSRDEMVAAFIRRSLRGDQQAIRHPARVTESSAPNQTLPTCRQLRARSPRSRTWSVRPGYAASEGSRGFDWFHAAGRRS